MVEFEIRAGVEAFDLGAEVGVRGVAGRRDVGVEGVEVGLFGGSELGVGVDRGGWCFGRRCRRLRRRGDGRHGRRSRRRRGIAVGAGAAARCEQQTRRHNDGDGRRPHRRIVDRSLSPVSGGEPHEPTVGASPKEKERSITQPNRPGWVDTCTTRCDIGVWPSVTACDSPAGSAGSTRGRWRRPPRRWPGGGRASPRCTPLRRCGTGTGRRSSTIEAR